MSRETKKAQVSAAPAFAHLHLGLLVPNLNTSIKEAFRSLSLFISNQAFLQVDKGRFTYYHFSNQNKNCQGWRNCSSQAALLDAETHSE